MGNNLLRGTYFCTASLRLYLNVCGCAGTPSTCACMHSLRFLVIPARGYTSACMAALDLCLLLLASVDFYQVRLSMLEFSYCVYSAGVQQLSDPPAREYLKWFSVCL